MWIDTHCHLTHERFTPEGGVAGAVRRAGEAGVGGMVTINCRISDEFERVLAMARAHPSVWCTIGTHPHDAGDPAESVITAAEIAARAQSDPAIIGIGESGLDYHYMHAPKEAQQESFRKHIRACIAADLPLVVHAREADEDVIRLIREEGAGTALTGVMHSFSSGRAMGDAALEMGFYISFSGMLTFKKAEELRDFAKDVPLERLLVETDAPFLAPEPQRGHMNEPAFVPHTGARLAVLHAVTPGEMARRTTENFYTLFAKARDTAS